MKKFFLLLAMSSALAGTAIAGDGPPGTVIEPVTVEQDAFGMSAGNAIPILLLVILVAAAVAD